MHANGGRGVQIQASWWAWCLPWFNGDSHYYDGYRWWCTLQKKKLVRKDKMQVQCRRGRCTKLEKLVDRIWRWCVLMKKNLLIWKWGWKRNDRSRICCSLSKNESAIIRDESANLDMVDVCFNGGIVPIEMESYKTNRERNHEQRSGIDEVSLLKVSFLHGNGETPWNCRCWSFFSSPNRSPLNSPLRGQW